MNHVPVAAAAMLLACCSYAFAEGDSAERPKPSALWAVDLKKCTFMLKNDYAPSDAVLKEAEDWKIDCMARKGLKPSKGRP